MGQERDHAVVLGGSIAGILAARVLADRYAQVTVLDRDRLPTEREHRTGVPQGRHIHDLLPRGKEIIEQLFPGTTEELAAQGAPLGRMSSDMTIYSSGVRFMKVDAGLEILSPSRPLLEAHLRSRLLDMPNVTITDGCVVHAPVASEDRITGVRVSRRDHEPGTQTVSADLVVDATGRASKAPAWLETLGYEAPREEGMEIDLAYTTAVYPRRAEDADHHILVEPDPRGAGVGAVEDDRWVVTLIGVRGTAAPTDERGFVDYASSLAIPDVHHVIRGREPLSGPVLMRYPTSCRRRYEDLSRFPQGFVVTGDALASFNPVYAQGMSVAALEAVKLGQVLDGGGHDVGRRFFSAVSGTVDVAWDMAARTDAKWTQDDSRLSLKARVMSGYSSQLTRAASHDPVVASALLEVMALVSHPKTLVHPRLAMRVMRGALRTPSRLVAHGASATGLAERGLDGRAG